MRFNKLKAFTLAEVMILLLTLSILLAAFAPVFTTRYSNYSSDDVWAFVPGDDNNDAYFDTSNKSFTAQAFVGISPANKLDVMNASSDDDPSSTEKRVYSKLVIRATNALTIGKLQNQMQFRYANNNSSAAGSVVGTLFAGNGNVLLGGKYNNIKNDAKANTAYGQESMSALTTGVANTAAGFSSLASLTSGNYNTAVGFRSASKMTSGTGNIFIGYEAGYNVTSGVNYNTIIGNKSGYKLSGSYNTAVGNNIMASESSASSGSYNTALGNYALNKASSGSANTAIGYNSMSGLTSGSYNTAFGDNSCLMVSSGSYKTCIGTRSGSKDATENEALTPFAGLFTGNEERVFIGGVPVQNFGGDDHPGAVLEVHNVDGTQANSLPMSNVGNASVVINGNLIVRGISYFEMPIATQYNYSVSSAKKPKGLVAMRLVDGPQNFKLFAGYDGADRAGRSYESCRGCRQHKYDDIKPQCICTAVSSKFAPGQKNNNNKRVYDALNSDLPVSTSYDWTTPMIGSNGLNAGNCDADGYNKGGYYVDTSVVDSSGNKKTVKFERNANNGDASERMTERPLAHISSEESCCPMLKSDIRLKNVGEKFTAGLNEIRKLNIYNYTFKNDSAQSPHVGVIAQDLKKVFPTAVSKDKNGFYKIRWDEMFYAAINSIKTLNAKIEKLAAKVATDRQRIATLKKDNAALNAKLDRLADELAQIEAKKK